MPISEAQLQYKFDTFRGLIQKEDFWKMPNELKAKVLEGFMYAYRTAELSETKVIEYSIQYYELLDLFIEHGNLIELQGPLN